MLLQDDLKVVDSQLVAYVLLK
jgi:hypothetical protein